MDQLDGKVAIVTGATSGIGERIAEMFVAEGARVVAAGRRETEGRTLQAKCGSAMSFVRTDVTDEASVKAMIDHAVTARFGAAGLPGQQRGQRFAYGRYHRCSHRTFFLGFSIRTCGGRCSV